MSTVRRDSRLQGLAAWRWPLGPKASVRPVLRSVYAVFVLYSTQRMLEVQAWETERLGRAE